MTFPTSSSQPITPTTFQNQGMTTQYDSRPTAFSTSSSSYAPPPPQDFNTEAPPPVTSNTYHQNQSETSQWALPPGWKTCCRESDGRIYYWEMSTGRTSWSHPLAPTTSDATGMGMGIGTGTGWGLFGTTQQSNNGRNTQLLDSPHTAYKRPDSHQCCALFSCIVFPPLGICALGHSLLTDRSWKLGNYGDSVNHSRQAYTYAWWAVCIFVLLMIYWYFITGDGFPDFNFWD